MPATPERTPFILVEECFAQQDPGFLSALRSSENPKQLAAFADRWKKDGRPWAREQIIAYLEQPLNCRGHQVLVKRLFKDAEERRDDELMGAFLVAFDNSIRRVRNMQWRWDYEINTSTNEEVLHSPHNGMPGDSPKSGPAQKLSRWQQELREARKGRPVPNGRLYSYPTRFYLRRRTWRYFRWMGYQKPDAYPAAVAHALRRYRDDDLGSGENILDSWSLLNICFRETDVLEFRLTHHRLKEGRTLGELKAAPRFPKVWETEAAGRLLLDLVLNAPATLVRLWAMDLVRTVRAKVDWAISADQILALLDHADERVQQFGAELFQAQTGLEKLPIDTWLRLLGTRNLTALAALVDSFRKHVAGERLSFDQLLKLSVAKPVPVARLGIGYLYTRALTPTEVVRLAKLAEAQAPAVAGELTTWALQHLGAAEVYQVDAVSRFFDSLLRETRAAAWAWLTPVVPAYRDPVLWSRLAETPFDDLRLKLIDHLAMRSEERAAFSGDLAPVWSSVLLGVHRGGRQKLKAVQQVAEAILRQPDSVTSLLPVLVVAVRSIRGPEARAALAAVMRLIAQRPELAEEVRGRLPELKFELVEVVA